MRSTVAYLVLATLLTGCASVAGELAFPRVDSDDDDRVSLSEFSEFIDDVDAFDRYDDDDDGELDQEEYREAVDDAIESRAYFRGFDRDRSGGLSSAEFERGIFQTFDADDNGSLNENELESAVGALSLEL